MNDKTSIIVVMDCSGSMANIARDMEGGFNAFIEEQAKQSGEADVTLVQFDSSYGDKKAVRTVFEAVDLKECPKATLYPGGGTPLNDAIGQTINAQGARFAKMKPAKRPGKVVFVIITDGEENSSVEFTAAQVKAMVKHQEEKYGWQFVYLAANVDAFSESALRGVSQINTVTFRPSGASTRSLYGQLGQSLSSYRAGASASVSFTDDQRKLVEDGK